MNDNSLKYQLPYGELLRTILIKQELTEGDLKKVVKSKGIFLSRYSKDETVPELMCTLLSPDEYSTLLDLQKNKEEKEKYRTASIPWQGGSNLIKSIPSGVDLHQLLDELYTYKSGLEIIGIPSFKKIDGREDKIEIEFEIKEHSELKDIHSKERIFKGGLVYELKDDGHLHLSVTKTFSSKGTQNLVDSLNKKMEKHFKEQNAVKKEDTFERILFSQFTNEDRFLFFIRFLADIDFLEYNKLESISVAPDPNEQLPADAKQFLQDIENLNLKGNVLKRHMLISELVYRKCILLHSMTVNYKFQHAEGHGNCLVEFAFPDFKLDNTENLEFQFYTIRISIDRNYRAFANRNKINKAIFEVLNSHKIYQYNTLKI